MNVQAHKLAALFLPILIAVLLAGFAEPYRASILNLRVELTTIEVQTASELSARFDQLNYHWPVDEGMAVPAIALRELPPDLFSVNDVKQKKSLFFRALLPIVLAENKIVEDLRVHIVTLFGKGVGRLSDSEQRWLEAVAKYYKVSGDMSLKKIRQILLARVDVVPVELALAQAANESAWGTSRFARQGNNLFGQWTYRQSEGIVPLGRPEGESYAVRAFPSIDTSVRAYIHNLNTNRAYSQLRKLRKQLRDAGQELDGDVLAAGLLAYSARGEAYIEEIRAMMRSNRLAAQLNNVTIAGS